MTQIQQMRDKLAAHKWRVVAELEGGKKAPLVWQVQRAAGKGPFHLEFKADKSSQIELAFGVRIRELKQTSIYLYRQSNDEAWARVLDEMITALDEVERGS
jgi:hypothetical protein